MFAKHSETIFELLQRRKVIPSQFLESLRQTAIASDRSLADILVAQGVFDRSSLIRWVAQEMGLAFAEEIPASLPVATAIELPAVLARKCGVVPLRATADEITLLIGDPFDWETRDDLDFALTRTVRWSLGDPDRIQDLVRKHYAESLTEKPLERDDRATRVAPEISLKELQLQSEQGPVVQFVDLVLRQAVVGRASDIHLEPFEAEFKIRYRIDGVLREMSPPPSALALPIASRLKVLANLDIAERRLPQDGRISYRHQGRKVDFRISTLPTQFGESVVLRVLDQDTVQLNLDQLGLPADLLTSIVEVISRPNGLFIVTGPTGSGKTTTLYGALRKINSPGRKLLTAEDPVEYEIEGVTQVPVNAAAALTFADVLRSFLRQDPDVIMVGEIRDAETAAVAVQASLTGHLVLSTLHTNDAPAAVTRLVDMGVEPFLIASALSGILAQRLVRRICPSCRQERRLSDDELASLALTREEVANRAAYHGAGCGHCSQSGYRGRMGLFEWLPVSDSIRDLITENAPVSALRDLARAEGMTTLREQGLRALFAGETTLEEIAGCT